MFAVNLDVVTDVAIGSMDCRPPFVFSNMSKQTSHSTAAIINLLFLYILSDDVIIKQLSSLVITAGQHSFYDHKYMSKLFRYLKKN